MAEQNIQMHKLIILCVQDPTANNFWAHTIDHAFVCLLSDNTTSSTVAKLVVPTDVAGKMHKVIQKYSIDKLMY